VANFRVYDKFVGEDQALEIWDAQKDAFGRAKSSMTLYKGRLGLGTTEPEGRLAVLDEPHNLEEFPPRAMTGYKNHFEGHGEFCVSASSVNNNYPPWAAFDDKTVFPSNYISPGSLYTTSTAGGISNGGAITEVNGVNISGEWIQIQFPVKLNVKCVAIKPPRSEDADRAPQDGFILGSNDGNTWTSLLAWTGITTWGTNETVAKNLVMTKNGFYRYFRLIITRLQPNNTYTQAHITEIQYFGTREQGQSVLHDGQLTLTKSLNVPRIGPALDADDTPRRDRLVVEYNTSTNPTFEGAVRDTSGRGLDGMFYGGASYDASQKALGFDAVTGTALESGILPLQGDAVHSFSLWFNRHTNGNTVLVSIATSPDASPSNGTLNGFYVTADGGGSIYSMGNDVAIPANTFSDGSWFHVVCIYKGGGVTVTTRELYVNSVKITFSGSSGADYGDPLNFTNPTVALGAEHNGRSNYYYDGSISQFKLYDTALTAEEVKTLYDMGRCDEGHHVVNFSKTRVGIGLGDGEAPQAALDVRGSVNLHSLLAGATGGSETEITDQNISYKVHSFTTTGTSQIIVHKGGLFECLVVAGGGGGGNANAGGGGGGGVVIQTVFVHAGTYNVVVGTGNTSGTRDPGHGAVRDYDPYPTGRRGANSTVFNLLAIGGGNGGGDDYSGVDGGSGGGCGDDASVIPGRGVQNQEGSNGYGNRGGYTHINNKGGAGGGGAGEVGFDLDPEIAGGAVNDLWTLLGRDGGNGVGSTIRTGSIQYYGAGGGGSQRTTADTDVPGAGIGGKGGGGNGAVANGTGSAGSANTGGGGGGSSGATDGGNGGSGIVVVRYRI